jgi:prepilin peptidase CpaA
MPSLSPLFSDLLPATLIVVLGFAVWFDVREQRIPNVVTAGGFLAFLAARAVMGPEAFLSGLAGGATGLVLGIALFAAGAMGGGDGKLLAAVGAALGFEVFLLCLPLIGAFGGILALVEAGRHGTLIATLIRFRQLLCYGVTFGRLGARRTLAMPGSVSVPYGVAVAAGAATAWLGWGFGL